MKIAKAHKVKLNPTPEQEQYFWQAAGIARYSFNWGLARYNEILDHNRDHPENKQKVSGRLLKKEFNKVKPNWVNDVTCWAYQGAFDDLQSAFSMFWKKSKNGTLTPSKKPRKDGRPSGWPRFKSKHKDDPSFYLANISIRLDGHFVNFDVKRCGPVNMCEEFRFPNGRILGARISYQQGHWWISVQAEIEHEPQCGDGAVGIDLGIKYLAVVSDSDEPLKNPRVLRKALKKLRRLQRKLDRQRRANNPDRFDEKGRFIKNSKVEWVESNRMQKTREAVTKMHARIANIRQDIAHKFTTKIVRNNEIIGIEDLNIRGMMSNKKISKDIADAALYEKRRQLEYKAEHNGAVVVAVDRWYPSSKTCNGCGWVYVGLKLSERKWTCQECGQVNERDGNAAKNLRDEALRELGLVIDTRCTTQAESINERSLSLSVGGFDR